MNTLCCNITAAMNTLCPEPEPFWEGTEDVLGWNPNTDSSPILPINTEEMALIEGNFDKLELVEIVARRTELDPRDVKRAVDHALDLITEQVIERGYVELYGFGSFALKTLAAESGTDPQGRTFSVGERHTVEFNPFKDFRDRIEKETGKPAII